MYIEDFLSKFGQRNTKPILKIPRLNQKQVLLGKLAKNFEIVHRYIEKFFATLDNVRRCFSLSLPNCMERTRTYTSRTLNTLILIYVSLFSSFSFNCIYRTIFLAQSTSFALFLINLYSG